MKTRCGFTRVSKSNYLIPYLYSSSEELVRILRSAGWAEIGDRTSLKQEIISNTRRSALSVLCTLALWNSRWNGRRNVFFLRKRVESVGVQIFRTRLCFRRTRLRRLAEGFESCASQTTVLVVHISHFRIHLSGKGRFAGEKCIPRFWFIFVYRITLCSELVKNLHDAT